VTARSGTPSPTEVAGDRHSDRRVAVIGAGPIGLTLAARLAQHGIPVSLIEQNPAHVGEGSKALCMQRETLEIWARAGIGERVASRGVQWHTGRTYFGTRELFSVELPGTTRDHFPPFVNISQTEVEELLIARCQELGVDLRWGHRLEDMTDDGAGVRLALATEAGTPVSLRALYAVGTDGAHSTVRHLIGIEFPGHSHPDLFLICDIRARLPFPRERRFFFDPPWNPGRQVLIHPQPDDVWRIDWQIPPDTDIEAERASGGLDRRIRSVVGDRTEYELVWMTVYRFHQRLAQRFRLGNVFLAGDAAHLYAPFGARGLNSGTADAENLAWKVAMVFRGEAPASLLDTYEAERQPAAEENLIVTDATMRFMAPHGAWQRLWRNLTLWGSTRFAGLRRRVNSGRLAEPFVYAGSPIVDPGPEEPELPRHGAVAQDLQLSNGERLKERFGSQFVVLVAGAPPEVGARALALELPISATIVDDYALAPVYAPSGARAWVIRPDGHIASSLPLTGDGTGGGAGGGTGGSGSPALDPLNRLPELLARAAGR
jgi:3-(3-hydroxy-phenyl)propionate hydroxylase